MISLEELDSLSQVAQAATQDASHWNPRVPSDSPKSVTLLGYDPVTKSLGPVPIVPADAVYKVLEGANSEYVHTFKPAVVCRLLSEIRTLQAMVQDTVSEVEVLRSMSEDNYRSL